MDPLFLRYVSAFIAVTLAAIGTGIGQGVAGMGGADALSRQPLGEDQGFRAMVIGLALTETGEILTLVMVIMILFSGGGITMGTGLAELGVGLALGLSSAFVSYASSTVVKSSCVSISRQPFFAQKIITFMLIIQSIVEAPIIFSFLVSLVIKAKAGSSLSTYEGIVLLGAGVLSGISSIGPAIGQAFFASNACKAIGINRRGYSKIFPFSLLSQAFIETPVILSLLVSFMLIYRTPSTITPFMSTLAAIAAVVSMGVGSIGTGASIGYVASKACIEIAHEPENYGVLLRMSLVSQALIESVAIYSLIIAVLILALF